MPAVERSAAITYGGITVGGASDIYLLHGDPPFSIRHAYESIEVSCVVLVVGTGATQTEANNAMCVAAAALEVAARKINQTDIAVGYGTGNLFAGSHTANTAFLSRAELRKLERWGAGASALYALTIRAQRPADATGKAGLRSATVDVTAPFEDGRRVLTIDGTYTAVGASSATAMHDANIAALVAAHTTALTGTWVLDQHGRVPDDENKIASFSRTMIEVESDGLIEYVTQVTELSSGQKELTISGRYAALSAGARAAYEAGISTRVTATLTAEVGTYNIVGVQLTPDDQDRRISFAHRFREILRTEYGATSGLDNDKLTNITLQIAVGYVAPGDAPGAQRPAEVTAVFSATLDRSVTDPMAYYRDTIREPLTEDVRRASEATTIALVRETPLESLEDNRISVMSQYLAVVGGDVLERDVETTDVEIYPFTLWPVWNGNSMARAKVDGIGSRFREVRDRMLKLGSHPVKPRSGGSRSGGGSGGGGARPDIRIRTVSRADLAEQEQTGEVLEEGCVSPGPHWHEMQDMRSGSVRSIGVPGTSFIATELVTVCVFEYGELVPPGGAGGDQRPGSTEEPIYRDSPEATGRPLTRG